MPDDPTMPAELTRSGSLDPAQHGVYLDALHYALALHTEFRKGARAVPYLSHLLDASSTVWEDGGDLDAAIAALLHDAVEDKGETRARLAESFGDTVAEIVIGCTDSEDASPEAKPPYLRRKAAHLDRLRARADALGAGRGSAVDRGILRVTAADKCSNLRAILGDLEQIGVEYLDHFKGGLFLTTWYYETAVEVCTTAFPTPVAAATDRPPASSSRAVMALRRELPHLQAHRDRLRAEVGATAARIAEVLRTEGSARVGRIAEVLRTEGSAQVGRNGEESLPADREVALVAEEAAFRLRQAGSDASPDDRAKAVRKLLTDCYEPKGSAGSEADTALVAAVVAVGGPA